MREGTCPAGPFPPELHTQCRLLELGCCEGSRLTHPCWGSSSSWGRFVLVLWLIVCTAGDSGSSELISQCSHTESKVRELSSVQSNSGKKKPWQFLTWSVYCTTTQLVTPTQGWAGGQGRSWNPCEWGGSSSWWFGCHNSCFWHCFMFAACPASWGNC